MFAFAILFMLLATFFIGWKVGASVQDEVVPARKYLQFGIALIALIIAFLVLRTRVLEFWLIMLCIACAAILVAARKLPWLTAALGGVLCGFALFAPLVQADVAVLSLLLNYLLGATSRWKELPSLCVSFLCASLAVAGVLKLV